MFCRTVVLQQLLETTWVLKKEALQFFAVSGTSNPVILCHIPEGYNPQLKNII
jgi:hypothetical protein